MTEKKLHGTFKITPITPIHISDGEKYQIFEYYIKDKQFYLKDILKFFQDNYQNLEESLKIIEDISFTPSSEYIRYALPVYADPKEIQKTTSNAQQKSGQEFHKFISSKHTQLSPEFKKIMKESQKKTTPTQTKPSSTSPASQPSQEIFSFIKDPLCQVYIPGSSLKGCIRTAITYTFLNNISNQNNKIKEEILKNAKYDLFKTLVIRDSKPFTLTQNNSNIPTLEHFAVCQIQIVKKSQNKIKPQGGIILAECLMPTTQIDIPFYIDLPSLISLKEDIKKSLENNQKQQKYYYYQQLFDILKDPNKFQDSLKNFSHALIDSVDEFYKSTDQNNPLKNSFTQHKTNNEILLQLGFGTGYLSKTIALVYTPDERNEIQKNLRLGIGKRYTPENPFPRSRKLITTKQYTIPTVPMGWFKLDIDWKQ